MVGCKDTYETASGYISVCHLEKGHTGQCCGQLMGSVTRWETGNISDEYQHFLALEEETKGKEL